MSKLAERFMLRFSGLERSHGIYVQSTTKTKDGVKVKGLAKTVSDPLTQLDWENHLAGKTGLGIVPIRDDSKTCLFGAIDVDVYNLDILNLEARIRALGLPLIPCRTKSGGVHLYLFLKTPTQAKKVRSALSTWANQLGFGDSEIFPKQDKLKSKDHGSWINLPYFNGNQTDRWGIFKGKRLKLSEFLSIADSQATDLDGVGEDPLFYDGPPCIQALALAGLDEGIRNEGLFAVGIYLKKRDPDGWEDELKRFNREAVHPPLDGSEMGLVLKSLGRKDYAYPCKRPFMTESCDKEECFKRKHGIKAKSTDPGVKLDGLVKIKTDPPTWFISVNSQRVQIDTEDLLNQRRFNHLVVEALNILPRLIKPQAWEMLVQELLSSVSEEDAPPDASKSGQLLSAVEYFISERPKARNIEEIILGKCWTEDDKVFFRSSDILKFLETSRFRGVSPRDVWNILRGIGGITRRVRIKGKLIRLWGLPSSSEDTEVEIPVIVEGPDF